MSAGTPTGKKTTSGPSYRTSSRERFRRNALPPSPDDASSTTLVATITEIKFSSPDGQFSVVYGLDENDKKVVLRGSLAHVRVGEGVECHGKWVEHRQHGWGFTVDTVQVTQPHTIQGIKAYLASSVPGIGPKFAKAIVETFGEQTFEIIDADPNALFKVRTSTGVRLSGKRVRSIMESWEEARSVRKVMVFLTSHGVTAGIAARIHRAYGERSLKVLNENPYTLVEIRGIGFRIADRIARNLGTPLDSPRRIRAGIIFCLQESESAGHCYLGETILVDTVLDQLTLKDDADEETIEANRAVVREELEGLVRDAKIILESADEGNRCWLPDMLTMERRLARNVASMLPAQSDTGGKSITGDKVAQLGGFSPNEGQMTAIDNAIQNRISLITGLPGTGKTTLIKLLLHILEKSGVKSHDIVLAAPTGKAARRMQEATGREASTIHKLLKWDPSNGGFVHDENDPLHARFAIIDETSMVDLRLADALFRAVGKNCNLILVGDADQLPPVGAGKVFEDLISSGVIPSVRLTEIFRQAQKSLIVRNAHRIVAGERPYSNPAKAAEDLGIDVGDLNEDFFFVHREDPEQVADTIVQFAASRIPRKYGLDPVKDVLVLAPMKAGPCGLEELNRRMQRALNPDGAYIGIKGFRVGDRVIQTRNDYQLEIMNGEVGRIVEWNREDEEVVVDFLDRKARLKTSDLESFLSAWAISVHRSQGSQAKAVVCAVATSHWIMLTRSLVNTAITRAQELCVCVGQVKAMAHAVRTLDAKVRYTGLSERIQLSIK